MSVDKVNPLFTHLINQANFKKNISTALILKFYDPQEELILQVDNGIGAVLMQNNRLLEYASRALTASEKQWAQIEKETLSVVFGLERFDQYTVHMDNL